MILTRTASVIRSADLKTVNITLSAATGIDKIANFSFDTSERKAWPVEWQVKRFKRLWKLREDLEFLRYKLQQNIKVVTRIEKAIKKLQDDTSEIESHGLVFSAIAEVLADEEEDLLEWHDIEALESFSLQIMDPTTECCLQTVQAANSQLANTQARRQVSPRFSFRAC